MDDWKETLFNLYLEVEDKTITLPGDKQADITALPYLQYGPKLRRYINGLDWIVFEDKFRNAKDITIFMFDIASNTKWGGTPDWLILMEHLIFSFNKGVIPCKIQTAVRWIFMMKDSWRSLDNYGRAIITHILFKDDPMMGYGKKTKYIKSLNVTDTATDSFYKLYLEVEKEYKRPEKDRIPQFKKALENAKPIIILMQKKRKFA